MSGVFFQRSKFFNQDWSTRQENKTGSFAFPRQLYLEWKCTWDSIKLVYAGHKKTPKTLSTFQAERLRHLPRVGMLDVELFTAILDNVLAVMDLGPRWRSLTVTVMASCKNPGVKLQYRCRNLIKFASLRWWTGPLSEEVFMSGFLSPMSPSHILVIFPSDSEWSTRVVLCAPAVRLCFWWT